jgi:preprotein translocase subunit SecD
MAPPCRISAAAPGVLVQNVDACVIAAGPWVSIGSADLEVLSPDAGNPQWRVLVGVDPAGRTALAAFTRAQTGKQLAFVVRGRVLPASGTPLLQGSFSTSFEVVVDGRAGADALISRLRPGARRAGG